MEMMKVTGSANFQIRRIHVVDKSLHGYLESTFYNFETDRDMYAKWNALKEEIHYSMDMINETVTTTTAFHK